MTSGFRCMWTARRARSAISNRTKWKCDTIYSSRAWICLQLYAFPFYCKKTVNFIIHVTFVRCTKSAITTEWDTPQKHVFHLLERLKPTATGIDGLPVWFLRLSAPWIASPISHIFNMWYSSSVVPVQWLAAVSPRFLKPTSLLTVLISDLSQSHLFYREY